MSITAPGSCVPKRSLTVEKRLSRVFKTWFMGSANLWVFFFFSKILQINAINPLIQVVFILLGKNNLKINPFSCHYPRNPQYLAIIYLSPDGQDSQGYPRNAFATKRTADEVSRDSCRAQYRKRIRCHVNLIRGGRNTWKHAQQYQIKRTVFFRAGL
jgi:hypothetical protein